ncbi:MAG: AAA family ATPase [Candidatus Eisenbacteria bacterium]|uniref:AAA family ATPase n=1 Tax=Eiseniibacteriota bacterium TaxID=2212470 RepID=A0A937XAL6_UNCEI|nr:AAA family ATPase [Candidatus Eisenbacteria bacterium]
MYEAFYGLREAPFNLTPDPRFLFMTPDQREALAYLKYGIQERKGFLVLSGEVGVGKTLIVRTLLGQLNGGVSSALVMNAMLSFGQLLRMALMDFGVPVRGRGKLDQLLALQQFLLATHAAGGNAVLVVDEAQNLSPACLEEFRLLSNLETSTAKLIQIVFVGQPELIELLNSHKLRQLRQRIPGVCELHPLEAAGVAEYVEHRLRVASEGRVGQLFDDQALGEIAAHTRGVPRLINALCDRALLIGYVHDRRRVGVECVREAIEEMERGYRVGRSQTPPAVLGVEA